MKLDEWNNRLAEAETRHETAKAKHYDHQKQVEALKLEIHRAPHRNEELAELQALAVVNGEAAPDGEMIDVEALKRQLAILEKQAPIFTKAFQDASRHKSETEQARISAYRRGWWEFADQKLPRPKTIRQSRPSLSDYKDVTVGDLFDVYLLRSDGRISGDPRRFGEFVASLFSLPHPDSRWPDVRKEANAWTKKMEDAA